MPASGTGCATDQRARRASRAEADHGSGGLTGSLAVGGSFARRFASGQAGSLTRGIAIRQPSRVARGGGSDRQTAGAADANRRPEGLDR